MNYLAQLKATNFEKQAPKVLPKLPKATLDTQNDPFDSKDSSVSASFQKTTKSTALIVTCYTPAGNPIEVEARDEEHAAWLKQMNPQPLWCVRKEKNTANG